MWLSEKNKKLDWMKRIEKLESAQLKKAKKLKNWKMLRESKQMKKKGKLKSGLKCGSWSHLGCVKYIKGVVDLDVKCYLLRKWMWSCA